MILDTELAGTFAPLPSAAGRPGRAFPAGVGPAETVQERGVRRLNLRCALYQVDRLIEPLTVIRKQVTERIQRVRVERVFREQVAQRYVRHRRPDRPLEEPRVLVDTSETSSGERFIEILKRDDGFRQPTLVAPGVARRGTRRAVSFGEGRLQFLRCCRRPRPSSFRIRWACREHVQRSRVGRGLLCDGGLQDVTGVRRFPRVDQRGGAAAPRSARCSPPAPARRHRRRPKRRCCW